MTRLQEAKTLTEMAISRVMEEKRDVRTNITSLYNNELDAIIDHLDAAFTQLEEWAK